MVTTAAQKKTRANLLELLESFSQCGTPTLSGAEIWQRVGAGGKEEHLEIGETVKMATHAKSLADQLHFWKQVGTLQETDTWTNRLKGEGESGNGDASTFYGASLRDPPQNCHQAPLMTLETFLHLSLIN